MNNELWLGKCIRVAEMLYCAFPYEILAELYAKKEAGHLDKEETIRLAAENGMEYADGNLDVFEELGYGEGFFRPALAEDEEYQKYKKMNTPFADAHLSELEVDCIIKEQENADFYIPTEAEIEAISTTGMIENKNYKKIGQRIKDKDYLRTLWQNFCCDVEITDEIGRAAVFVATETMDGLPLMDMEALNELTGLIMECHNSTNKRSRRGWEPNKLRDTLPVGKPKTIIPMSSLAAKNMREAEPFFRDQGVTVDYDAGFGEFRKMENGRVKKIKVGRNEPCPCGSGKKYKKCHGRGDAIKTTPIREAEEAIQAEEAAPWDTIVVIGPGEGCELPLENFYFQCGMDEGVILIGKEKRQDPTIIKAMIELHDDEPNNMAIANDRLYDIARTIPTMMESDGFMVTVGLYDRNKNVLILDLLRGLR